MARSTDMEVLSQKTDVINQLAIILRTAKMHSINNAAVVSGIDKFLSLVNEIISFEKNIILEVRGEYFHFNDDRIRYMPGYILNYDYLIKEFKRAELGTVIIKNTLLPKDVRTFIEAFLKAPLSANPFDFIEEKVSEISCVELTKLQKIIDEELDARQLVKKTYFNAVSSYKAIFNKIRSDESINLKRAKRIITSIVNHIIDQEQILLGMTAIKDYDEYTYHHSTNVSILSVALGRRLGMSRSMLIELGIVALFHDIGKIKVPNEILNRSTGLTDAEWAVIKKHPRWGVQTIMKVRNIDSLTINAAIVAMEHHMNINHSGYPRITDAANLDLFSRIVSIADQYDAMTSERVYSAPISPDRALQDLLEKSGDKTDPLIMKFFVNMVGVYPTGTLVALDSGELGLVYENNEESLLRPVVMIISDSKGNRIKTQVVSLTEKNERGEYSRTITKTLDPDQHHVNLAEYLL